MTVSVCYLLAFYDSKTCNSYVPNLHIESVTDSQRGSIMLYTVGCSSEKKAGLFDVFGQWGWNTCMFLNRKMQEDNEQI